MSDFAYFQEQDSEQFSFFRIPKILFSDERFRNLSSEAKILYGLMLDRVGLSRKNGWVDAEGNVYIHFTIEEMMSVLKWSRYRIFQLLDELDEKEPGIDLIERRRVGHCKPNVIYVKNFASVNRRKGSPDRIRGEPEAQKSEVRSPDLIKYDMSDFMKSVSQTSGSMPAGLHEVCQSDSNNTDKSNIDKSDTDITYRQKSETGNLYGTFSNVKLADRELKELKGRFPYDWENWIERLSSYMASTGKRYRNHYATICSWAVKEQKSIPGKNYDVPDGKGF